MINIINTRLLSLSSSGIFYRSINIQKREISYVYKAPLTTLCCPPTKQNWKLLRNLFGSRKISTTCLSKNISRYEGKSIMESKQYHVEKDTIIFRYEETGSFKMINFFAISQFLFWSYLSHFAFTAMKDSPVSEEMQNDPQLAWWRKINFGEYRLGMATACFMLGWGTMAVSFIYTLRCVKYLILKKGGNSISFVTFSPSGKNRYLTVPIEQVSARQSRVSAGVHLPIKVKGKYMHYILDMRGVFPNVRLFDNTAGLRRNLS